MNQKLTRLSQRYLTTLRKHLQTGAGASLRPALGLGRQAVAHGLETLDLARIHEQSLVTLMLPGHSFRAQRTMTRQAAIFFTEASIPIEETHRAARQTQVHLGKLMTTLGRRTQELAVSNRQVERGAAQRKVMEDAFEKKGKNYQKCLEESLELQKRLRQLTHQIITAQEDERKKISLELQDEIAQTLLGINVRLLSLKQEARSNNKGLKNEIASTQWLVVKSVKSVRQVGRKIGSL
ncbi:MAG: histidine kinase [Verrucomicrobiota bacterium]